MWRDRIKEAQGDAWESTILNREDSGFSSYCQLHNIHYGSFEWFDALLKFYPGQSDEKYMIEALGRNITCGNGLKT